MSVLKNPFCSSVYHDVANRPYSSRILDDDDDDYYYDDDDSFFKVMLYYNVKALSYSAYPNISWLCLYSSAVLLSY